MVHHQALTLFYLRFILTLWWFIERVHATDEYYTLFFTNYVRLLPMRHANFSLFRARLRPQALKVELPARELVTQV